MIAVNALQNLTGAILGILGFAIYWGNYRQQFQEPKVLSPNVLLTRRPLVFITGKRSAFFFKSYWRNIPLFLRAHGYEVYILSLPWIKNRDQFFQTWLKENKNRGAHLFVDKPTSEEFEKLLSAPDQAAFQNLTINILTLPVSSEILWRLIGRIHQFIVKTKAPLPPRQIKEEYLQQMLNQAIHLAEIDFHQGT